MSTTQEQQEGSLSPDGRWRWEGGTWRPVATPGSWSTRKGLIVASVAIVSMMAIFAAGFGAYLQRGVSHGRWSSIQHPCTFLSSAAVIGLGLDAAPVEEHAVMKLGAGGGVAPSCRWTAATKNSPDHLDLDLLPFDSAFTESAEGYAKLKFDRTLAHDADLPETAPGLGDQAVARHNSRGDEFEVRTGNVIWSFAWFGRPDPTATLAAAQEVDRSLRR